ncbi:MAG: transposase [Christensenellaceae bacterium]
MNTEKEFPKRKNIRLQHYDYSSPGAYFVTICTEKRTNLFWNGDIDANTFFWCSVGTNCVRPKNLPLSDIGKIVIEELEIWNKTYDAVSLHSYVVMPNHLHVMIGISADEFGRPQVAPTIERMIGQFKGAVTKKVGKPIWQRSFMEHVMRNRKDYEIRSNYIYENPLRWHYDELYLEE